MESVDKLRKLADKLDEAASMMSEHGFSPIGLKTKIVCDEIEREIAERYMELPVDAEGVPIRVGDVIQFVNEQGGTGAKVEVCAISRHYAYYGEGKHFYKADMCRHVKSRSLEDVLAGFRFDAMNIYEDLTLSGNDRVDELQELDSTVAAEIRELLGGDAE